MLYDDTMGNDGITLQKFCTALPETNNILVITMSHIKDHKTFHSTRAICTLIIFNIMLKQPHTLSIAQVNKCIYQMCRYNLCSCGLGKYTCSCKCMHKRSLDFLFSIFISR